MNVTFKRYINLNTYRTILASSSCPQQRTTAPRLGGCVATPGRDQINIAEQGDDDGDDDGDGDDGADDDGDDGCHQVA